MVERTIETAVVKSVSGSNSLRTTVPQVVATMMGLSPGDHMVWLINPQEGTIQITRIAKEDLEPVRMGAIEAATQPEGSRRRR